MLSIAGALCCALIALSAFGADTWRPDRPVELVVPATSGGGQDITARVMQKIMQEQGLAPVPVVVVNKPGGGGNIAYGYVKQHPGDGRFIATATPTMLTNNILDPGSDNYTDFTALGMLYNEYVGFASQCREPFQDRPRPDRAREKKSWEHHVRLRDESLGIANHIALAVAMKAGGADIRKLTIVIYKSSADATLALMGGPRRCRSWTPLSTFTPVLQDRTIAVAPHCGGGAATRVAGNFAGVPTWREQGIDAVTPRVIAPSSDRKGMSPEQIAYWDNVFQQLVQSETWKKAELERNEWESTYMKSAETRKSSRRAVSRVTARFLPNWAS